MNPSVVALLPLLVNLGGAAGFAPSLASAQSYYEDPDYELTAVGYRDHTGSFSHFDIGLGWTEAIALYETPGRVETRGLGTAWHLAIGGSVLPGLNVHFSAFGFDTIGADQFIDGKKVAGLDAGITSSALGAGATYYLPANLYFSGSLGLAFSAAVNPAGDGRRLDAGLAARGAIGYEFWIGSDWGLGIAGQLQYLRARDDNYGSKPIWHAFVFSPAFTVTSN